MILSTDWLDLQASATTETEMLLFMNDKKYLFKTDYRVCARLGALHWALALLPILAAAGRRPSPPSTSQNWDSSQAETGCQHHFCPVGWVKAASMHINRHEWAAKLAEQCFGIHPMFSQITQDHLVVVSVKFAPQARNVEHIFIWFFQNNTTPPRTPG